MLGLKIKIGGHEYIDKLTMKSGIYIWTLVYLEEYGFNYWRAIWSCFVVAHNGPMTTNRFPLAHDNLNTFHITSPLEDLWVLVMPHKRGTYVYLPFIIVRSDISSESQYKNTFHKKIICGTYLHGI